MRKFLGMLAVVGALSLGAVDNASAAGPFCITFPGFCDSITIRSTFFPAGGNTIVHGEWDWTCAGDCVTPGTFNCAAVLGGNNKSDGFDIGTAPTDPSDAGFTVEFKLKGLGGTASLYGHFTHTGPPVGDAPFAFIEGTPWAIAAGICPGQTVDSGKPSLMSLRN